MPQGTASTRTPQAAAIHPPHAIEQHHHAAPQRHELEPALAQVIIARRRLMTARAHRSRATARPHGDLDGLAWCAKPRALVHETGKVLVVGRCWSDRRAAHRNSAVTRPAPFPWGTEPQQSLVTRLTSPEALALAPRAPRKRAARNPLSLREGTASAVDIPAPPSKSHEGKVSRRKAGFGDVVERQNVAGSLGDRNARANLRGVI